MSVASLLHPSNAGVPSNTQYLNLYANSLTANTITVDQTVNGAITAGTYTPVATVIANCTIGPINEAEYLEINKVVKLNMSLTINPTAAATALTFSITLPAGKPMSNVHQNIYVTGQCPTAPSQILVPTGVGIAPTSLAISMARSDGGGFVANPVTVNFVVSYVDQSP